MRTTRIFLGLCLIALSASVSFAQNISTVAGNGAAAYSGDGGLATAASLYRPHGVAVDASGNIYIADSNNNCIRKVSVSTGVITTIAGTGGPVGAYGGDGGPATMADLNYPSNVCLDASGNLYITDYNNHAVRKVNTSGIITTIAGTGYRCTNVPNTCGDGGPATMADLNFPHGIAVDNAGNVYIGETENHSIRKVSTTGIISTIAGDPQHFTPGNSGDGGPAQSSLLSAPEGLAFDVSGNLYIADSAAGVIRKVTANSGQITGTSIISRIAGIGFIGFSGDGGPATSAKINIPSGIVVDATGNIYISDKDNRRIRKINTSNIISTICGTGSAGYTGDGGPATLALIADTWQLAVDACGNLYIADNSAHVIRKILNGGTTPAFNPSITSATPVCSGGNISAIGQYSGTVPPDSYSWQLQSCTSTGILTSTYNSGVLTYTGAPTTAAFSFPNTSNLPCNQNYLIMFTVKKNCPALSTATTTKQIFINCKPTPVITGNAPVCQGNSTTLCVNYQNNAQYTVKWTYYVGMVLNNSNAQCITVSPTATTSYNMSVKDNATGCTGNTSLTVAVVKNNPDFTYKINYTSPSNYFTVSATPVNLTANSVAGFGDLWVIEELDASGNIVPGTATNTGTSSNPTCWWVYPAANTFKGFDGTQSSGVNNVNCLTGPSPGKFANGSRYRITRGTWNNLCPWAQTSHIITVTGNRNPENITGKESDPNANVPDYSHLKPSKKPPR